MFLLKHPILPLHIRKQARACVYGIKLRYANLLLIYTDSKQRNTFGIVEFYLHYEIYFIYPREFLI